MPYADKNSQEAVASRKRAYKKYYSNNREAEIKRKALYNSLNKDKVNSNSVKRRSTKTPKEKVLFLNAKNRAKAKGIPFDLEIADIVVPDFCPILGIPLVVSTESAKDGSPSIDRIVPEKGYVKGNIQIISHKANTIKSNASLEELEKVYLYMRGLNANN
jgi:hypothetical protein